MEKRKLLIVAKDLRTHSTFEKQIHDFFQDQVHIIHESKTPTNIEVDLILASSAKLVEDYKISNDKLIIARRAIDISKMEELVSLEPDTRCVVVNNMLETSLETIELLRNLGFEFDMLPYYPGCKVSIDGIHTAIYAESVELIPRGMKKVINIGIRPLDVSTIIEIAVRFNANVDRTNIYSARYIQEIIEHSRRFYQKQNHINELNKHLDTILHSVHDGIITTDPNKSIIQINNAAKSILGIRSLNKDLVGKNINEFLPWLTLTDGKEQVDQNQVYSVNNMNLVLNNTPITLDNQKIGVVTAFQDVTKNQKVEQEMRKDLQGKGLSSKYTLDDIVGNSDRLKSTLEILKKIAPTDKTVLILGDNGTGKELFAHSIHYLSKRRNGPFLPVNFAGLPQSIAESELFGYEGGSFTGAKKNGKQGLFELANHGTLFLDEIGDASPSLQVLLLRVLQEKQVMRVGGEQIIPIDVRIIAATNRSLKKLVEEGKFRQDLYYRLLVLPLRVPSLRERKEDIPLLLEHFVRENSLVKVEFEPSVMNKLISYDWPGNIRELNSVVQYMTSVMSGNTITDQNLPEQFRETEQEEQDAKKSFLEELENKGDLNSFYVILECLEAKNRVECIGRGKVVEYSIEKGFPLTDQQVRHRMDTLKELGLIISGRRGQGSRITASGLNMLTLIKKTMFSDSLIF
jgi:PAS domain S-box-containing protein